MQSSHYLKTAQIGDTPYSFSFSYEKNFCSDDFFKEEVEVQGLDRVKMNCSGELIKKQTNKFFLKGKYEASFASCCHLCSENFSFFKQNFFSLFLLPQQEFEFHSSHFVDNEEDLDYYEKEELDLASYFQKQFLLDLPFCVKCKDDCKGLCSVCLINLNLKSCNCHSKPKSNNPFAKYFSNNN